MTHPGHRVKRPLVFLFLCCSCFFAALSLRAQGRYSLIYDKNQSAFFGASNAVFVQKAIISFQDKFIPDTIKNEEKLIRKGLGFGYRISKLFLLDFQQDFLFSIIQHEGFGHAARLREFGGKDIPVTINLFFPFGSGHGSTGGAFIRNFTPHEQLASTIAGVGANQVLANDLFQKFFLEDSVHFRQTLLYLISQNDQLFYIWADRYRKPGSAGGGDMLGYVRSLKNLYSPGNNAYTIGELSLESLASLVNPLQLYAAFTLFYCYAIRGEKYLTKIPMIKFGDMRYLPFINYRLTPFGSEFLLCNVLRFSDKLFMYNLAAGEGSLNNSYGIELKFFNLVRSESATLNLHLDAWEQPELELEKYKYVKTAGKSGVSGKIDVLLRPFKQYKNFNFFGQLGYKTKGFLIDEPLDKGMILRYGISLSL